MRSIGLLEAAHQRIDKQTRPVKHLAMRINNPYRSGVTIIQNAIVGGQHANQAPIQQVLVNRSAGESCNTKPLQGSLMQK